MESTVVFPHQLFEQHPALKKGRHVFLFEDPLFFSQYNFHKQKLILHRASMKSYAAKLTADGYEVTYLAKAEVPDLETAFRLWSERGVRELHYAATSDYLLERRLKRYSDRCGMVLKMVKSPDFMLTKPEFEEAIGDVHR